MSEEVSSHGMIAPSCDRTDHHVFDGGVLDAAIAKMKELVDREAATLLAKARAERDAARQLVKYCRNLLYQASEVPWDDGPQSAADTRLQTEAPFLVFKLCEAVEGLTQGWPDGGNQ